MCIFDISNKETMSKYYNINGLKVRVSDHEPNHSMNRFRGANDIEFYTQNIERKPMSVVSQVEWYCEDNDLDIALFAEVLVDFPDAEYVEIPKIEDKVQVVSQEFLDSYNAIGKKKQMTRRCDLCDSFGVNWLQMRNGNYIVK
jgi:hypothetical protein